MKYGLLAMQAIIISFESLAANSLGCYGNEWIETPHWDRLAATGVVFDRHFADTLGHKAGMAWANGRHAHSLNGSIESTSLTRLLKTNGVVTKLIAAGAAQDWHRSAEFDEASTVTGVEGADSEPDKVPFAELVKAGIAAWNDDSFRNQPRLLWLHSPAPSLPPKGFDSLYFEDFEERGERIEELPDAARAEHPAVYAGMVSLIDHWLGELLTGIEADLNAKPTLVIVMSARGHLWHRIVSSKPNSSEQSALCDQRIRTPLVLNVFQDGRFQDLYSLRSDRLVQTCDLIPTLLDWFEVPPAVGHESLPGQSWLREATDETPARPSLWIGDDGPFDAVRTAEWLCIRSSATVPADDSPITDLSPRVSLFLKPEDIWDVNDIASQQLDVVSELLQLFPQ